MFTSAVQKRSDCSSYLGGQGRDREGAVVQICHQKDGIFLFVHATKLYCDKFVMENYTMRGS